MRNFLLAAVVGVAACGTGSGAPTTSTIPNGEAASVVAVSDGDTLTVRISGTEVAAARFEFGVRPRFGRSARGDEERERDQARRRAAPRPIRARTMHRA